MKQPDPGFGPRFYCPGYRTGHQKPDSVCPGTAPCLYSRLLEW